MLIRELAEKTGLPSHTIRFYEREGLIDERFIERGGNNYRRYSQAALERVWMIKQGQAAGFTLAEIKTLMAAWDAGALTTRDQIHYIREKVETITDKINDLERIRSYLMDKLGHLHEDNDGRVAFGVGKENMIGMGMTNGNSSDLE